MASSGHIKKQNNDSVSDYRSLPEGYGVTEASLLPRDPNWMFIYWEVTADSKAEVCRKHGQDIFQKSRQVIRVYDVTGVGDIGQAGQKYFDVPIMAEAKSWYINVQESGRTYCCEVGLITSDGRFIGLVRTNTVALPVGRVSEVTDEKWMSVTSDFEKLLQLSGVEYIGKGSGEVAKSLAQRWEMLRAVFSRASSWGVSSLSSPALAKPSSEKAFWLVADCELILYGATEPDAHVTVSGRKVKLNPDGTFSMRFAFPDGGMELPIKAVSKDETEAREIKINVSRVTDANGK